jgi:hypothetical protein
VRSRLAIPRTRGVIVGLCLVVLGIWGAIIPFVGPYFHYAFISFQKWHFTYGRLWLDILPGAVTFLGGLMLMGAANRATVLFGGWLAAVAGAWFVIGPEVSRFWNHGVIQAGSPLGSYTRQTFEQLGYFYALGAVVTFLAAFAIGRASVLAARDVLATGRGRYGRGAARVAPAVPAGSAAADQPTGTVRGRPGSREPAAAPQRQPPAGGSSAGGGNAPA